MVIRLLENNFYKYLKTFCVLIIPIVLWFIPIYKTNPTWSLCVFKNLTGKNCYGCGISRATLSVLHLNFAQAFELNKFIIIIFPILLYLWLKKVIIEYKKITL